MDNLQVEQYWQAYLATKSGTFPRNDAVSLVLVERSSGDQMNEFLTELVEKQQCDRFAEIIYRSNDRPPPMSESLSTFDDRVTFK
jgi:hypothetical protein